MGRQVTDDRRAGPPHRPDFGDSPDGSVGQPRRRKPALPAWVAAAVVALLAATLAGGWLTARDTGSPGVRAVPDTRSGPASGEASGSGPTAPAPLTIAVRAPSQVVGGERAEFTIAWSDGEGIFSGTSEDWGDGVGASSLAQQACDPAPAAGPAGGEVTVRHTFTAPGPYTLVLGVSTYTCSGAAAVTETATKTVQVDVLPDVTGAR